MRRIFTLLLLALVLTGCANRLTGPDYAWDEPAFVAQKSGAAVPAVELVHRMLLIGDAGYYLEGDPTLEALGRLAAEAPSASVVFLGDNIYDSGLQDDDREDGERILGQQLEATPVPKIVLPGNHDWGLTLSDETAKSIRNQQEFVDGWPAGNAEFIPKDACMGPVARELVPAANGRPGRGADRGRPDAVDQPEAARRVPGRTDP